MKISVCTSVLNQSDLLRRSIDSVRAQTFSDWEHIIVDDGSTEDIGALVASYDDARLVYVRLPVNGGGTAGFKQAMALAQGQYMQMLAADEFLWERKFEVQVAWMDDHPLIGCTWGLPTPNRGQPWPLGPTQEWEQYLYGAQNRSREAWILSLLTLQNTAIGGASMLMRTDCMRTLGDYDVALNAAADLEWFVRFFKQYQGWILPYRLADATHPPERISAATTPQQFQAEMAIVQARHRIVMPPISGRITIGIPVRNVDKFVAESIQSVLAQTHADFDLVIFDDASSDTTADILKAMSDPRMRLYRSDENVGVAAANNHLLATCTTEFYMPFSGDDVLEPTFLARCLAEFARDPFLEMVASQTDFIDAAGQPTPLEHAFWKIQRANNKPREEWLRQLYYGNQYFGGGVYRTAALQDVGGWNGDMGVICDWDVYCKLLQRGNIHVIEENLTHTRAHDGQQSQMKTREQVFALREQYHAGRVRYWPPRQKVIIATPFYEMRGFSPYISSMCVTIKMLTQFGIDHEFWELSGDSYVDRAKNTIYNKFLEDPDATDLMMIDSDMQWNPQAVLAMLQMPEDIVQGSYPQKNAWATWTARPFLHDDGTGTGTLAPIGRMMQDGSALIKAEYLAGGFLRVKRGCLEKYRDAYPEYTYHDAGADPSYPERKYTEFFTCERARMDPSKLDTPQLRWGEDRVFGRRMAALGIESWIYTNIDFGHYGINGWMGNYDKYLRKPPEEKAA